MGYIDPTTKAWVYEEGDNPTTDPEYGSFSGMLNRASKQIPEATSRALASDPVVLEGVAEAVTADIAGRDLVEGQGMDVTDLQVAILDESGNRTWLEANNADGGPSPHALDLLRAHVALPETRALDGLLVVIHDAAGYRTWLQASAADGGPTREAAVFIRDALTALDGPVVYVAHGDSMTQDGSTNGTSWPDVMTAQTGLTVVNRGLSGTSMDEIAIRLGVVQLLTLPGGQLPATDPAPVTIANSGPWSSAGQAVRVYRGTVRGIPFDLAYTPATNSWELRRVTPGVAVQVASPVAFVPDPVSLVERRVHVIWGGRNNNPKSTVSKGLDAAIRRLPTGSPFLVVSVCNATDEPAGSAGYIEVTEENARNQAKYPFEYVDLRGRMIREGLALAGIAPTAADETAIGQDRVPPSLMRDNLHFNPAGRAAVAHILHDELQIRGLA
jgi:hypothetical protein